MVIPTHSIGDPHKWRGTEPRSLADRAWAAEIVRKHRTCSQCGGAENAMIHHFGGEFDPSATSKHEFVPRQRPWEGETKLLYALAATFDCELRCRPHSIPTLSCEERAILDEQYVSEPPTADWPLLGRDWCRSCTARAVCETQED